MHERPRLCAILALFAILATMLASSPLTARAQDAPHDAGDAVAPFPEPLDLVPTPGEEPDGDEVVARRTATSRTYETEVPGVFVTQAASSRVNFSDGQDWYEIDSTLVSDGDGGYHNAADSVDVTISGDASASEIGSVTLPDGDSVSFGLDDASPAVADVEDDTVTFADVHDDVDIELQSLPSGLKETLVLASADAPTTYTFPLEIVGLSGSIAEDGSVLFVDGGGDPRLTIPPGFMEDSSVGVTGLPASSTGVNYNLLDGGQTLEVSIDGTWLNDPARIFPVRVDPTLNIWSDADDTYVSDGITADRSTEYVLKVGYDGTRAHRSLLHFDLSSLDGLNIMESDLALFANGSGSCSTTPVDVYAATEEWAGDEATTWPGPVNTVDPLIGTIWSGLGHDGSCPGGFATTDVTRAVQQWGLGQTENLGLYMRARDEAAAAQFKQYGSSESYVPPTINVLWSDPAAASHPDEPVENSISPTHLVDTASPTLSAGYVDPEGDDGMVVFFIYSETTGAFLGAYTSSVVDSGNNATYAASGLPYDLPLIWRPLAVDTVNSVASTFSVQVPLVRPSTWLTAPVSGDTIADSTTLTAAVSTAATSVTSVEFQVNGTTLSTDTSAPYSASLTTSAYDELEELVVTSKIHRGSNNGATSPPVYVAVQNDEPGDVAEHVSTQESYAAIESYPNYVTELTSSNSSPPMETNNFPLRYDFSLAPSSYIQFAAVPEACYYNIGSFLCGGLFGYEGGDYANIYRNKDYLIGRGYTRRISRNYLDYGRTIIDDGGRMYMGCLYYNGTDMWCDYRYYGPHQFDANNDPGYWLKILKDWSSYQYTTTLPCVGAAVSNWIADVSYLKLSQACFRKPYDP